MAWARATPDERAPLSALHTELQRQALASHAELRAAVRAGSLRGAELRRVFESVALLERDHFVEEVLGIAYPPLEEGAPEQDSMSYAASGYDEAVHAFDVVQLSDADCVLDLGSGMGKVLLLAELLCGARAVGVERDSRLHELARNAAASLSAATELCLGDARELPLPRASVAFLYLPFSGAALNHVLSRLWPSGVGSGPRWLCSGPLSDRELSGLIAVGQPRSWLQVYRRGEP